MNHELKTLGAAAMVAVLGSAIWAAPRRCRSVRKERRGRKSDIIYSKARRKEEDMAETIKKWILSIRFEYPRSIFDMSPADLEEMEEFEEANIADQDGVRMDWIRVGEALTAAMGEYSCERIPA